MRGVDFQSQYLEDPSLQWSPLIRTLLGPSASGRNIEVFSSGVY